MIVRGIPHYCICIALVHQGRVALGLIYQAETNELYAARLGQGAFCNGQPIQVSATTDLTASPVELGWSKRVSNDRYLAVLANFLAAGVNVRRAGSGALGLVLAASAALEPTLKAAMGLD